MIRVAIQLSDIQFNGPVRGTLFNKRGPRFLTGQIEKRMGDRGTPTSNRREVRALAKPYCCYFLYTPILSCAIPPPFFSFAAFLSKR